MCVPRRSTQPCCRNTKGLVPSATITRRKQSNLPKTLTGIWECRNGLPCRSEHAQHSHSSPSGTSSRQPAKSPITALLSKCLSCCANLGHMPVRMHACWPSSMIKHEHAAHCIGDALNDALSLLYLRANICNTGNHHLQVSIRIVGTHCSQCTAHEMLLGKRHSTAARHPCHSRHRSPHCRRSAPRTAPAKAEAADLP